MDAVVARLKVEETIDAAQLDEILATAARIAGLEAG